MNMTLPLDEMTTVEKLEALEQIWTDLIGDAGGVPSPGWHQDELADRLERVERGDSRFADFDEAKARIRSTLR